MPASSRNECPHFIGGNWISGSGPELISLDPSTGRPIWSGNSADPSTVDAAVTAARQAFSQWSALPLEKRSAHLRAFAETLEANVDSLAEAISRDVGKPRWEARGEVQAMIGKYALTVRAFEERCAEVERNGAVTRFRPHGVVAVLGPFNFPGHLPNGHILPALLAGNTVVFKPSDKAPLAAECTVRLWQESGLPPGVLNLLQGGADTARALTAHPGIDGLFFTGSSRVGLALSDAFAKTPDKILALEMGGNNPLIVHDPGDLTAAAVLTIQSAFATSGQRCNCARRLILTDQTPAAEFLAELVRITSTLRIGTPDSDPEPFAGPLISSEAAADFLQKQNELRSVGARPLLEGRLLQPGSAMVTPAIWDVTDLPPLSDEETFGPLLQVFRVSTLEDAIRLGNQTAYGLVAGILSRSRDAYEAVLQKTRAGVINWNQPTTAASSAAPFGGVGMSGNHRPSAYFAVDYCAYPVASLENETPALPPTLPPGLTL